MPGIVRKEASQALNDESSRPGQPTTPISVTMLGALPPWRGVAGYTRGLLEGLDANGDADIEFIDFTSLYPAKLYPGGDPEDRGAGRPTFNNVQQRVILAWYNPFSWIWAGLTFRGSVLHAQWWSYVLAPVYLTILALARLRRRRVIVTIHNVRPHEGGRIGRWLNEAVLRLAHHFIVHVEQNAETLTSVYPASEGHITVVPFGMVPAGENMKPSKRAACEDLRLPVDVPVILAFGNIRPYKGLDVLLRAVRQVIDAGQDVKLAIAGEPWGDFGKYQALIEELDLNGYVQTRLEYVSEPTVQALFAVAAVAVFPYTSFDAQSAAAAVAVEFGVPLIVSDAGGLAELVDDPRAIVPANDAPALATALQAVLADDHLRAKLASDSQRIANENDWPSVGKQTTRLYRQLAKHGSVPGNEFGPKEVSWR